MQVKTTYYDRSQKHFKRCFGNAASDAADWIEDGTAFHACAAAMGNTQRLPQRLQPVNRNRFI